MAKLNYLIHRDAWVTDDGSYGVGSIIVFDANLLTDEQWDTLSDMRDNDKFRYVQAVVSGESLDEWED